MTKPVRSSILTRDRASGAALFRLALAPDGRVLPDVRAKALGRGTWIGVTRATLEIAIAKGNLKGALARAFKSRDFAIPADLPSLIAEALEKNALDRHGLECKVWCTHHRHRQDRRRGAFGQVARCCYHAVRRAAPTGRESSRRRGALGRMREGSDLKGLALPASRAPHCPWRWAAKMWYISLRLIGPHRRPARVSDALNRWLHFIGPDREPLNACH